MKKIHVLILKSFIRPFIVTFFIVMFVLLMLFLFKYIDDLVGKGFEWYVILELMGYQSLAQISMAMPLSMLLSAIMTFGNLGESYELVAIKSAGISLRKAMMPLFILVGMFAGGAFLFSDYILPVVNLKYGSLLYDVRTKPADFLIKPGVFNNTIPGYAIRAKDKSEDGKILYDLMIYDHHSGNRGNNVILAKEGYMYNSQDNNYMILKLKNGVRYEEGPNNKSTSYDPRQQFTRFYFEESDVKFNMEVFQMKRTDEELFRSHHSMLNLRQLTYYTDSTTRELDSIRATVMPEIKYYYFFLNEYYHQDSTVRPIKVAEYNKGTYVDMLTEDRRSNALYNASGQISYIINSLEAKSNIEKLRVDKITRYHVEWQKKFTLAASCILLFAIGAPLGAIIRKGGLGLPVVMAIVFFLIYYVISTVSEKAAVEGDMNVIIGVWMAIIVLTPLATFLTYKASTDSAILDLEQYRIRYEKIKTWISQYIRTKWVGKNP